MTYESFKDKMGRWRTISLFYEHRVDNYDPLFTLSEKGRTVNGTHLPSLKEMYLDFEDTTEYLFVTEVMKTSWRHWLKMTENSILKTEIESWREELSLKLQAKGIKKAVELSEEGNYAATKLLVDRGFLDKKKLSKTSKKTKERTETDLVNVSSFLSKVKG